MADDFATAASSVRLEVAQLERGSASDPSSWGWSGRAASGYVRTYVAWRDAAEKTADRMDSPRPGARQILNQLANALETSQRAYDDAVSMAAGFGLSVDANGFVVPRSVPPPAALASGTPEAQVEDQLATAARDGEQALESARTSFLALLDVDWVGTIDKINNWFGDLNNPLALATTPSAVYAGARYVQSARSYPRIAAQIFDDTFGPAAEAYARGDASLADLADAAWTASDRAGIARALTVDADRAAWMRGGMPAAFDIAGKVLLPLGAASDVWTIFHPGNGPVAEQRVVQGASIVNLVGSAAVGADMVGLIGVDAALGWVPVAGQVLLVGSALVLAGIWAYDNVPVFHDFCNSVGTETAHVAGAAWNATTQAVGQEFTDVKNTVSTVANTASSVEHTVSNTLSGAAHAVTGFFHWP